MILAAPLVIPFAEIIGVSIAALGMSKATDEVNKYIEANPEKSMKIFQMIMPSQGIANALKNKSSDEEVEEDVEVEEVDTRDLTRAEKAKMMKELAKSGGGNMREKMKKGYEEIIQPGESDRELDDAEDRYDGGVEDAPKPKFDYKKFFKKRYADGGAIGIEVLFENKNPRQGLFMGGSPLTGQALNIYNSMNAYGFDDQAIANALTEQGLYDPNASTTDTTPDTGQTIGYQGGNDGGGITELTPLNTITNISSGINRNDKTFIDPLNEKIANQMTIQNPNLNKYTTEEIISMNPDMFNIKTDKGFIGNTIDNFKTMGGSLMDKFSGSKVGQGATKFKNMAITPMMALMQKRNPLNPNAVNYNPNLQGQMDFLEGITGTKITGTSDNLQFENAAMIGQDPNSGLTKYGPGSVLSGQNVVSGFGSNDYEKALNKYLTRMLSYTNPTKFQQEKIKQAQKELEAAQAKQAIADMAAEQSTIDKAKSNYADVYQSAQEQGFTGPGGGFSTSGAAPGTSLGSGQFSPQSSKGRKDYSQGGLATMFKEKR